MPSGAPESVTSSISSGTPPRARSSKSATAASLEPAPWKRSTSSRASSTLASFGLRPASHSARSASISLIGRNDSSVK